MDDLWKSFMGSYGNKLSQDAAELADPSIKKATDHILKKVLPWWIGTVIVFILSVAILVRRK
jgi:hypothetical protein